MASLHGLSSFQQKRDEDEKKAAEERKYQEYLFKLEEIEKLKK